MRISDWSSDVCSSDLGPDTPGKPEGGKGRMTRLTQAQEAIREKARELAEAVIAPRAAEVDRQEAYPWDNCRALCEAGFFGMTLPREYGGPGHGRREVAVNAGEARREEGGWFG